MTAFSETPLGNMEQITLKISGKEMTWAVPKNDSVVQVIDSAESSAQEHYNLQFRVQFLDYHI